MTYRKRKRQAKPKELILPVVLIGVVLFAGGSFSFPEQAVLPLTIFVVCVIALTLFGFYYFVYRKIQLQRRALEILSIDDVDKMSGIAFEKYIAELFRKQGYRIQDTPVTGDFGVDLVIAKDGIRTTVQCKCYSKKRVNQDAIREAFTGMNLYKCQRSMVVTNSHFTQFARELAASNNCTLVDRNGLVKMIAAQINT